MELRSLGHRTDLIFVRYDGNVEDKGEYIVVRTPNNPSYWWGNYLIFAQPPKEGDVEMWLELFRRDIGEPPEIEHIALTWDSLNGEKGVVEPFLERGLEDDMMVVLATETLKPPPHPNTEAEFRILESDDDWQQTLELQVLSRDEEFKDEAGYRDFRRRKMLRYRQMNEDGLGAWFGAFLDGKLVADLGLYKDDTLGRFQNVETHPEYRRRGLCGTLVHYAGQMALNDWNLETLVMVADPEYHAARIYESVGFVAREKQPGLERPGKQ